MNKYVPGVIPGVDPNTAKMIRELYQRTNMLSDRIDEVYPMIPPVGAKKESPVAGYLNIPGNVQDGFARVTKDGVISSYTNPVTNGRVTPLLTFQGDMDVQVNVLTPLFSVKIEGNTMRPLDQIAFDFGGFVIGTPLVNGIVSVTLGGNTLLSVTYTISISSFYWRGLIGVQDTPNWDSATIGELGLNIFALADNVPTISIARGEFNIDWTVDQTLEFNGQVNGVAPAATVIEGISVYKITTNN